MPEHGAALAENLRVSPDVESVTVQDVEMALGKSILAQSWFLDGKLVCVWGIVPTSLTELCGFVWLITTKTADEAPFMFARYSKMELDDIMSRYTLLHGLVSPKYHRSIRWLKWLGFDVATKTTVFQGARYFVFQRRA